MPSRNRVGRTARTPLPRESSKELRASAPGVFRIGGGWLGVGFGFGFGFESEESIEFPARIRNRLARTLGGGLLRSRFKAEQFGEVVLRTFAIRIGIAAPGTTRRPKVGAVVRARLVDHPVGAIVIAFASNLRRMVPALPADMEIRAAGRTSRTVTDGPAHRAERAAAVPAHEPVRLRLHADQPKPARYSTGFNRTWSSILPGIRNRRRPRERKSYTRYRLY